MYRFLLLPLLGLTLACGGDDGDGASGTDSGTGDSSTGETAGTDSGGSGGSGSTGGSANRPADDGKEAIKAFLADRSYEGAGWTANAAGPIESIDMVSPHGRFRAFFNDELKASVDAGNSEPDNPHAAFSMAVKELYEGDVLVGQAAMYKTDGTSWAYYCWGPATRCSTESPDLPEDNADYGKDLEVACHSCHFGNVFTPFN